MCAISTGEQDEENPPSRSRYRVKVEPMDMEFPDEKEEPPAFGPAALGLHRVGTKLPPKPAPSEPVQKLNARGMPARIRKKNRFIFEDDFVNTSPPRQSPKKTPKILAKSHSKPSSAKKQKSPSKIQRDGEKLSDDKSESGGSSNSDHKSGHRIGMRLRNLLKLPKAHKWVCFEYFYSNIDRALFDGENDFMICLKESFPQLTNRKLTQTQWSKIRRMMGKPRRCSQSFFEEERKELERKRKLIRYIQQRKMADVNVKDLPNEIPMQLVVGTKVTARLRKPQDGLFTGSIDAVDTSNNTYRITFERPKLGTHSVPDYEVLSNDPPETFNLSTITQKFRPRNVIQEMMSLCHPSLAAESNRLQGDPMIGCSDIAKGDMAVGVYPFAFLKLIVKLKRILNAKTIEIKKLKEYNCEAEKRKSFGQKMPEDFERKYAACVIDLEKMNIDLQGYINEIQEHCQQIAPGPSLAAMLAPTHLRGKCQDDAAMIVEKNNSGAVKDPALIGLITDLTALMLQIRSLSDSDQNAYELSVLQGTMDQIKIKLDPKHKSLFQNHIETHMHRIQMGLGQMKSGLVPGV